MARLTLGGQRKAHELNSTGSHQSHHHLITVEKAAMIPPACHASCHPAGHCQKKGIVFRPDRFGGNGQGRQGWTQFFDTKYHNFAPRIGFAYDLTGDRKTSLRGGFGIFYVMLNGAYFRTPGVKNPPYSAFLESNVTNSNLASAAADLARIAPVLAGLGAAGRRAA